MHIYNGNNVTISNEIVLRKNQVVDVEKLGEINSKLPSFYKSTKHLFTAVSGSAKDDNEIESLKAELASRGNEIESLKAELASRGNEIESLKAEEKKGKK